MDDNRLCRFTRQCELLREGAPLLGPRGVVVVIIEAAFAYRDRAVSNEFADRFYVTPRIIPAGVVRMYPRCVPDVPRIRRGDAGGSASGAEDIPGAAA